MHAVLHWASMAPSMSSRQVFILPEVERLLSQDGAPIEAANALLKTLEEPGDTATFILATRAPYRVTKSIRSHAIVWAIKPLAAESLGRLLAALRPDLDAKELDGAME